MIAPGWTIVWASVIGAVSAVLGMWVNHATARSARRDALMENRRRDAVDAVADLVYALDAHRAAMWELGTAELEDRPASLIITLTATTQATRVAITKPEVRVLTLLPALAKVAKRAIQLTYDMYQPVGKDALTCLRQAALEARERVVEAAAKAVKGH
jgi:hypothetical protein